MKAFGNTVELLSAVACCLWSDEFEELNSSWGICQYDARNKLTYRVRIQKGCHSCCKATISRYSYINISLELRDGFENHWTIGSGVVGVAVVSTLHYVTSVIQLEMWLTWVNKHKRSAPYHLWQGVGILGILRMFLSRTCIASVELLCLNCTAS